MRGADRRKPSRRVATSSDGSAAAHTVKRRETLRILTRMSIRPSCGPGFASPREAEHVRTCIRTGAFPHLPVGGYGSPVRCSHSLAGAAIQRFAANRREVNELALTSKLQPPGRLIPPGTAPGPVRRPSQRNAPPPQAHFWAAFVIGPSIFSGVDTPASSPPLSSETELGPFNRLLAGYSP